MTAVAQPVSPRQPAALPGHRTQAVPSAQPQARAADWGARLTLGARFASLVYLFMIVFLLLAVLVPVGVAGWQPLSVISGSMQPAVKAGAVVMVEPAEADVYYAHPSIVAYDDPVRPGSVVTHRVRSTTSEDGTVWYTTKGDANNDADSDPVAHGSLVGAVRMVIPFLGLPASWLANDRLLPLVFAVTATLAAMAGVAVRSRP